MQLQQRKFIETFKTVNINAGCDPLIVEVCLSYIRHCFNYNLQVDFDNIYLSPPKIFNDPTLTVEQRACLERLNAQVEQLYQLDLMPKNFIDLHLWYCYNLIQNGCTVLFNQSNLARAIGLSLQAIHFFATDNDTYIDFEIPKRDNKRKRLISAPLPKLRQIQRWILDNILGNVPISKYATAYIQGRSTRDNASSHIKAKIIINLDLKDFFPSITFHRVLGLYLNLGYVYPVAVLLAKLSCHNGQVPQGAPTSPAISNILCHRLDKRLAGLAQKTCFRYTRYADDITFSGERFLDNFIHSVKKIVENEGFQLNEKKTRIIRAGKSQRVTGLVVNEKVNIPRAYYRRIRAIIHNCQRFGPNSQTKQDITVFKAQMYGHAHYINSITPERGRYLLEQLDQVSW